MTSNIQSTSTSPFIAPPSTSSSTPLSSYGNLKITDFPKCCAKLIESLIKQPEFNGTGLAKKMFKVLPIGSYSCARMTEIIYRNIENVSASKTTYPYISSYRYNGFLKLTDSKKEVIDQALVLQFYKSAKLSVEDLEKELQKVLTELQNGWIKISSGEQSDQCLFFKKSTLDNEEILIRCIVERLSQSPIEDNSENCVDKSSKMNSDVFCEIRNGIIFLYIKNAKVNDLIEKCGFNIQDQF